MNPNLNWGALRTALILLGIVAIMGFSGSTFNPLFWLLLVFGLSRLGAFAESFSKNQRPQTRRRDRNTQPNRSSTGSNPLEVIGREIRDGIRREIEQEIERNPEAGSIRERMRQQRQQLDPPNHTPFRTSKTSRLRPTAQHAVEAVRRAGLNPANLALSPVDLGLMVYTGAKRPVIHREASIPDTADYVQPFVEMETRQTASGVLRFEIVDSSGTIHYTRDESARLNPGRTLLQAKTRMPVGDFLDIEGDWSLRIYAGDVLLAEHPFAWYDPDSVGAPLRDHLSSDGELSADLERLVESAELQPISLDELLGSADEGSAAAQQQQRR